MIRSVVFGLAFATLAIFAPLTIDRAGEAVAQTVDAPAGAEEAITAWYRDQVGANLIEPVSIFYGDFTGDGAADALAWGDYDTGGSSANHIVALFRNRGGEMVLARIDEGVYGTEPRNVVITRGLITLTTTMPRPGDPHCCPTGERAWAINTN